MAAKNSFFTGFDSCFKAWKLISRYGLWHFFLYPIALTVLLGMGISALLHDQIDTWVKSLGPFMHIEPLHTKDWKEVAITFWNELSSAALRILLWITALLIYWKISKYLVLMLMSPVMAYLSEKTEFLITGKTYPFSIKTFFLNAARGMLISSRNFFLEMLLLFALLAIDLGISFFFAPASIIITPAVAILSFLISTYFYGFSMFDYISERKGQSIQQSTAYMRSHQRMVVGNGTAFALFRWIPLIGNPIAIVTCTIGAVIAWNENEKISG
ncbi:MAG: hypothetical protein RLZZ77_548 [Bacteroidota bacterium]|jgi:CysZ protein